MLSKLRKPISQIRVIKTGVKFGPEMVRWQVEIYNPNVWFFRWQPLERFRTRDEAHAYADRMRWIVDFGLLDG